MNILSRRSRRRLLAMAAAPVMAAALLPASAWAIVDMTGYYQPIFHEDQPERVPGPDAGDYAGMPINDAARTRADTWTGSLLTLTERQCIPHPSTYGLRGVGNLHGVRALHHLAREALPSDLRWQRDLLLDTASRLVVGCPEPLWAPAFGAAAALVFPQALPAVRAVGTRRLVR